MKSIFRREWRAAFHGLRGFLFVGLFCAILGAFLTVFNLLYGYSNFEFDLSYLTLCLWLLLPFVTVPLFREDREGGAREFLASLPLSPEKILGGKILAAVALFGISALTVALSPLILGFYGTIHYPSSYVVILAFILYGLSVLSIELFVSMAIRKPLWAWIVSYAIPLGAIFINYLSNLLPTSLADGARYLSIFGIFTPFVFGSFDLRIIGFYLVLVALFLFLTLRTGLTLYGNDRRHKKQNGVVFVATAILLALLLNTATLLIPTRYRAPDVSARGYYSISENTEQFLNRIDEDVTLYVIRENDREMRFEYFLEAFAARNKHIKLQYLMLKDSDEVLSKVGLNRHTLTGVQYLLIAETDKRAEVLNYSSFFYYKTDNTYLQQFGLSQMTTAEYSQYTNYFYQMASQNESYGTYLEYLLYDTFLYFQGDALLSKMIEYVTADRVPKNYLLTGHGEWEGVDSLFLNMLATYGIGYETLDLSKSTEIPADAVNLLVFTPTSDYSISVTDTMKEYLNRGGQMIFVTKEENLSMPNLTSLLASYGLRAEKGAVWDEVELKDSEEADSSEETTPLTEWQKAVSVTVNTQHDLMAINPDTTKLTPSITGGNAISFGETSDPSLILTPLLTTSENASIEKDPEGKGEKVLAAAAETASGTHLVWFTGADSYTVTRDAALLDENLIYNNFCLYLAMNWTDIHFRSGLTTPEAIRYTESSLTVESSDVTVFGVFTILLIPAALITGGVILRHKRKKA